MNKEECKCNHTHIKYDVGLDYADEGEEHQHLETCCNCGNWRILYAFITYDDPLKVTVDTGKWIAKGKTVYSI
jgi:hypothetical protein